MIVPAIRLVFICFRDYISIILWKWR